MKKLYYKLSLYLYNNNPYAFCVTIHVIFYNENPS
jgi:hypothetical protein